MPPAAFKRSKYSFAPLIEGTSKLAEGAVKALTAPVLRRFTDAALDLAGRRRQRQCRYHERFDQQTFARPDFATVNHV